MEINQLVDSQHVRAWKTKDSRWIFDRSADFSIVFDAITRQFCVSSRQKRKTDVSHPSSVSDRRDWCDSITNGGVTWEKIFDWIYFISSTIFTRATFHNFLHEQCECLAPLNSHSRGSSNYAPNKTLIEIEIERMLCTSSWRVAARVHLLISSERFVASL